MSVQLLQLMPACQTDHEKVPDNGRFLNQA